MKIQIKSGKYKKGTLYGDGNASKKIIKILKKLSSIKIQKKLLINYEDFGNYTR